MKLAEIIKLDSTYEEYKKDRHLLSNAIAESFDSKVDIIWTRVPLGQVGSFYINQIEYKVQFHETDIPNVNAKRGAEVSFMKVGLPTDDDGFSTTHDATNISMTIYAVVYNAIIQKKNEYDVFYFTAEVKHSSEKEYPKKVNIYSTIARKLWKEIGGSYYKAQDSLRTSFLVTVNNAKDVELYGKFWKNHLKEDYEYTDWSTKVPHFNTKTREVTYEAVSRPVWLDEYN